MIVSFSGIDSAGKTTQIILLEKYCIQNGISLKRLWGKARGTPGVLFIKSILRRDKNMTHEKKLEYRRNLFENNTKKKILLLVSLIDLCWYFGFYYRIEALFYKITLLDRYIWDTYIEVKTEFTGIDFEKWLIWKLLLILSPSPKVSFLLVIPPEESFRRDIQKNDLTVDSLVLKEEKINLYLRLSKEHKWTHIIDGMHSVDDLNNQIISLLKI